MVNHRSLRTHQAVHDIHRHGVGVGDHAFGAEVPRRDDGGEAPFPGAAGDPGDRMIDRQLDGHIGRCRNVPKSLREEVRPLLLHQCSRAALEARRFVIVSAPRRAARRGP